MDINRICRNIERPAWGARVLVFLVVTVLMVFLFDTIVNTPVGEGNIVSGHVTQPCIAVAREGNVFSCKVGLGDGASTTFKTLHAVRVGTEVTYRRQARRFGGYRYELDDIHDTPGAAARSGG